MGIKRDLIDRQALIGVFAGLVPYAIDGPEDDAYARGLDAGYQALVAAPPVDAEPVRKGVWYKYPAGLIVCSECEWFGNVDGYGDVYNFCPRCGADMREGENSAAD